MEGQKLKQDGDSFRQKLNTQQLFDDWKKKVEAKQMIVQGKIFNIVSQRTRTGTILKLQVNFTPETITLAKEVCEDEEEGELNCLVSSSESCSS